MSTAIVYFTRSGATRAAAEYMASRLGADMFELRPAEPYPEEYRAVVNRAVEELRAKAKPPLAEMPDVSGYDAVLVGSPNWCGTFAAPVGTFLAGAPLEGKHVGIFCTSGGSGLGRMPQDAAALAKGALFYEPLSLLSASDTAAMDAWLEQME